MYWALEFCYTETIGTDLFYGFERYGHAAQVTLYSICVLLALHNSPNKLKCVVFVLTLHRLFVSDFFVLFYEVPTPVITGISLFFFAAWMHVARRPTLPKQQSFDVDNILLAFYTGNNGSFIMNLFQTMDEPVSSMCILSGKYSLKLKRGRDCFKFTENHGFFREWDNYHIIDTGVKSNDDFIENMRQCGKIRARKFGLRINCIIAVKDLLGMIGEQWRPIGLLENSPSGYFRKASRL